MSLDRFENKDEVIGVSPVFGKTMFADEEPRIEKFNDAITQNDIDGTYSGVNTTNASEIHIYAEDNLIESLYGQPIRSVLTNGKPTIFVVPELDLRQAGLEQGNYSVLYNFHHNVVSDLRVAEISADRTEVRLVSKTNTPNVFQNLFAFNSSISSNSFDAFLRKKDFVLNFSNNNIYDVINLQFDGPRVGELTGTLSYPTAIFNGTPTVFIPLDDTISGGLGIWRTFIEVYRPAINQTTQLLGEPTGRFRKYELQQNPNGTLRWNAGQNTFVSPDIPSDVPSDIQSFVKNTSITDKRFQIDEANLNLNYNWFNNTPSQLNTLIVRLLRPLESLVEVGDTLGVDARILKSWTDKVIAFPALDIVDKDDFSTPNFAIELDSYGKSDGTDWKTWNDLLDANLSTSQQIIDYYFSGSLGKIKLNIQYSDFQNFIHFSSATERVDNFYYKVQQIQAYNDRIDFLTSISSSNTTAVLTNVSQSIIRRDRIVGAFDGFEYWLYYQDTSSIYTHWSSSDFVIKPYPKVSTYPYVLNHPTSSEAESWYSGVYASASLYDSQNPARLRNMIPVHLQEDDKNSDYITFIDMIGQHFDISWTYIKALTDINRREEHPWDGMSDDLLFNVAKSMGWSLSNGYGDSELWNYVLGTDQTGSLQQAGQLKTKSREKIVKETWRRIVNNLPYIYKTKGTPRSIKALLATYGIPQAFLQIREYGGPTIVDVPNQYEHERFVYKVNIDAQAEKYIVNPWGQIDPEGIYTARYPRAIEVIAKLPASSPSDDGGATGEYTIFDMVVPGERIALQFNWINSTSGNFRLMSGSTALLTTNNFTWNGSRDVVMVLNNDGTTTSIRAAMPDSFGGVLSSVSASISTPNVVENIWLDSGSLNVGSPTDNDYTSFNLQELRYYYNTISQEIVEDHAKNRDAYFIDDNTTDLDTTGSFVSLLYRQFFDSRYGGSSWNSGSLHPNQEITTLVDGRLLTASFGPSSSAADLEGELDTYYSKIPSAGALNVNNNKIRIESSSLAGVLSPDKSQEKSQYDYAPLDSNLVGVYFSTTDTVNYDIYNSEGYFEIDDWVGDTDERYNESYPLLKYRAQNYFAKYTTKTALNLILSLLARYDSSIFSQIKQVLPARVNYMSGILIEPHILERNKYKRNRGITREFHQYVGNVPLYLESNITATRNDYGFSSGSGILNDGTIDLYNYLPSTYQYQIATLSSSISCSVSNVNTEVSMSFRTDISINDQVLSIDAQVANNASDYEFYNGNAFYVYEINGTAVFQQVSNPGNTSAYGLLEVGTPISNGSSQITLDSDWEVLNTTSNVDFKLVANNTQTDPWDTFTSSSLLETCQQLPSTYVNRTNGYWEYSPTGSQAVNARTTSQAFIVNRFFSTAGSASRNEAFSSSLSPADVQEYRGLSIENLYFNGCRITSDSLTTDSTDTPDGGPVIEVNVVDSNTLVLSTKTGLDGDLRIGSAEPIQTMVPTELVSLQNYERSLSQESQEKRNDIDTEQAVLNAPFIYTIPSRPLYRDAVSTQQQVGGNITIQTNFIQPRTL
jgi:hypothetical protein